MIPKRKILTVDDSKTVRMIVRKTFREQPYEIVEAENGVQGLEVARKEQPDLIFLDITMPLMDGVEMLTRLKSDPRLKEIPVTMLTAEGGQAHVGSVMQLGASAYILKPFKPAELVATATRFLGGPGG